ncbi:MAG: P-II family nitrogen regulator [Thermogutta sp.]|nr:P-II family nitrogen regulator [Thermogutta sp.]
MKLVLAVIQPAKLESVREALDRIEVGRLTITDAQGFARGSALGRDESSRLRGGRVLRKSLLEIVVNDDFAERTVNTIAQVAKTGRTGHPEDGKIFVLAVEQTVRISDGALGPGAV